MKIKKQPDLAVLSGIELRDLIAEHIKTTTGRRSAGGFRFIEEPRHYDQEHPIYAVEVKLQPEES